MASVNIDWGALQQPNMLGGYLQGQQVAQDRQRNVLNQQRQASSDQMQREQFGMEKEKFGFDKKRAEQADALKRGEVLTTVAQRLKGVPAGQRKSALDRAAPLFQASGIDPSMFGQLSEDQLSDEALDTFTGQVAKELQFFQTDRGIYAGDRATGEVGLVKALPGKPQQFGDYLYIPEDGGQPQASQSPTSGASGFNAHIDPLLKREGGFTASDGRSGAPANFGINQKYNPDVDVRNLTADKAKELYKTRYWDAINGDSLPPEAQAAVFDAAVNQGPGRAKAWWQQSGGDLQKFNELRLQHYRSRPDYEQNRKSWEGRVAETGAGAPLQGGAGGDTLGSAPPSVPGFRVAGRVKAQERNAPPSGYRWAADGNLEEIPGGPAGRKDTSKAFDQEQKLRAQFGQLPQVKDMAAVQAHVRTIGSIAQKARAGKATATDDLAMIFAFMKMLDPGSVVREGEFANAQNTAGIPDRVVNAYNRALKGTRLSDKQRAEFFNTATQVMDSYTNSYADQSDRYRGLAGRYDLNPDNIAAPTRRPAARNAPAKAAPTSGWGEMKVR